MVTDLPANAADIHLSVPRRRVAVWIMALLLGLAAAWAATTPFRLHFDWLYFEQDDFFYYYKVAQNLVSGHGSTFNGIVPTNGYHPLWLLALAALMRLGAGPHGVFVYLIVVAWVVTMITYLLCVRIFRRSGIEPIAAATCSAFVCVYCMHLYNEGMEVTFAIPAILAVVAAVQAVDWWSAPGWTGWRRCAAVGLLVSVMILSRLDTALLAVLLAVGIATQPSIRSRVKAYQLAGAATGLLPVLAYVISNRIWFGVWMPVSGMAKDLKLDHGFTSKAVLSLGALAPLQLANFIALLLVLIALPWLWQWLRPIERAFAPAVLLFPYAYLITLSWVSDWQLWPWYFYGLRTGLCVAIVVLFRVPAITRFAAMKPVLAVMILVTLARMYTLTWQKQFQSTVDAGYDIQQFATTHPGIYAMGDRAGVVSYLLPYPIIQTEGLVMDRQFLQNIANQVPLRQALAPFHARYYVATSLKPYAGCFQATEPWQGGPHTPHMRDTFCQPPLAHFEHEGWHTWIFDLQKN